MDGRAGSDDDTGSSTPPTVTNCHRHVILSPDGVEEGVERLILNRNSVPRPNPPSVDDPIRRAVASIRGLGTAVPHHGVNYVDGARMAGRMSCDDAAQQRTVTALYRRTRIENRGSVLLCPEGDAGRFGEFYPHPENPDDRGPATAKRCERYADEAPRLAHRSARAALDDAGVEADDVTHLVTVSCTGFSAPGVDVALIDGLGLPPTTQRVAVGFMGCHGAINGLRAAAAIAASDPAAVVLMTSVELCSLHYQYGFDPDRIVSGSLFADGSASAVVAAPTAVTSTGMTANGSTPNAASSSNTPLPSIAATGSMLVPDSREEMTWRIGDNGFEMTLSARVPALIEAHLAAYLDDFLRCNNLQRSGIGGWAVHPGGPRILDAAAAALDLSAEQLATSRAVLRDHGNMSSATMMFILRRFRDADVPPPYLMLGFGPGLEIEVALLA